MKEGTKPIGQVQPGDVVVGLNAIGGERQLSRVVERHDNLYSGDVVEVKIGEEPVIATAGHPFWVVQGDSLDQRPIPGELADATKVDGMAGRWVDSVDLQAGDQLLAADGHPVAVDAVTISHRDNLPVSNLTVEGDHCYHVGDAGVLVHNQAWCDLLKKKIGPAPQSLITAMESLRRAGQIAAGTGVHAHHIVMKTIPTKLAARMHPETAGRMREVLLKSHKILKDAKINSLWPNADGVVGAFAKTLPADKLDNLCWAINGKIGDDPLHTLRYAEKVLELLEEGALDGPDGVRAVLAVMRKKFHRAEVFW